MAIVYVHENYSNAAAGGAASVVFSPATAVAAGNHAIVIWASNSATTGALSSNASGATVQTDIISGTNNMMIIGSIYAPNGITTSNTITVTATGGGVRGILAEEFSGLATSSWFDKSITSSGTALLMSVGPTAATTQADELAIAGFCVAVTTVTPFTKDAAYSYFTTGAAGFSTATKGAFAEYRILAAAGAQTATATQAGVTARTYNGALATYKAAASVSPPLAVYDVAVARASNF